jgi:LPS-assembly lipoprotein
MAMKAGIGNREPGTGKNNLRRPFSVPGSRFPIPAFFLLLLSACGFEPLYATNESASKPALLSVRLAEVKASDIATPVVTRALARRTASAAKESEAEYDLVVTVREQAQQLAVQIDDSVTRYNYRLLADYVLTPRDGGDKIEGEAEAVASFNVVASQYSTLYAEDAAREKAARSLAEKIERDILLAFAGSDDPKKQAAAAARAGQK